MCVPLCYVGGSGFYFNTRDPFELFRDFFGDDPFSGMFGGSMFTDFGGVCVCLIVEQCLCTLSLYALYTLYIGLYVCAGGHRSGGSGSRGRGGLFSDFGFSDGFGSDSLSSGFGFSSFGSDFGCVVNTYCTLCIFVCLYTLHFGGIYAQVLFNFIFVILPAAHLVAV